MSDDAPPARLDRVSREAHPRYRPWRLVTAGCELVVAAATVWWAIRLWGLGVKTVTVMVSDGTRLVSTRFIGSWMTGAIALGMVAGILLVDVVREVLLGVAFRRRLHRGEGIDGRLTPGG
jgi:hypothetical protein